MPTRITIPLALVILATTACQSGSASYSAPRQLPAAVVEVAEHHMVQRGTEIGRYDLENLSFDYVDRKWRLTFAGKSLAIGDHFAVVVSDENLQVTDVIKGL